MKKRLLIIIIGSKILLLILSISSLPIHVRPKSGTSLLPNTYFTYTFNFTTDVDCSNVVLNNKTTILTDDDGVGFVSLIIPDGLSSIPLYLCEYRNGNLRNVHNLSDQFFKRIFADSGNFTNNISSSWYIGKVNHSSIQNVNNYFNQQLNTTSNTTFNNLSLILNLTASEINYNATQMSDSNGLLNILESSFTSTT